MILQSNFKNTWFYALLKTLGLIIYQLFVYSAVYSISENEPVSYFITYSTVLISLIIWKRKSLIEDLKSIKEDLKDKTKHIILMYILFYSLTLLTNYIIYKCVGNIADNESLLRESLLNSPILMSISLALLGPIMEELIFRYPYQNIKTNKNLKFIIYTLVFALFHILSATSIQGLLFLIPYIFLSLSITYSYYKTENIYTSMFFHIINNTISVLAIIIGG